MNQPIETRQLGRTGIPITPIGLGVMQFAGGKGVFKFMFPDISQAEMNAIIQAALAGGINWFDTAEMYGMGKSEQGLANALKDAGVADEDVLIATKWSPFFRTAGNISKTIGNRLRFLDGYTIDLYQVHQPYSFSSPEAEMNAMADLVEAGKIRTVGVSNFNAERMRRAHAALQKRGLPLASNQVEYSLWKRSIETNGILETAKELGITIIAWGPLASGLLSGKFHQDPDLLAQAPLGRRNVLRRRIEKSRPLVDALTEIGENYDASPSQVALNWLIHSHGDTVVAIPGASKVNHAQESAGAMQFTLSDADMQRLDKISRQLK
ncbi:MAG: aldo/keto reductase [Anaerolineales bacterium]|nr:aldo/keto reductase [Anaerolineales bacterium]